MVNLILASKSKVRKEILDKNNIPNEVKASNIDEDVFKESYLRNKISPEIISKNLAELKANKVSQKENANLVLGADSVIDLNGELISKPKTRDEALDILKKLNIDVEMNNNEISVAKSSIDQGIELDTEEFPGFPTDLQAQMMVLMSLGKKKSIIRENIFENRFMHVPELKRMGANIEIKNRIAIIKGPSKLTGAEVMATDLRASASLILAGLCAKGETKVDRIYHIDRGYERIEEKLNYLGANIIRLPS